MNDNGEVHKMIRPGELLRLEHVTCSYGEGPVLRDIDFTIGDHQFTGIVGPSGSGKTTLLKVLLGTMRPVHGEVYRTPGLGIGYVPQVETVDWSFPLTVSECVLLASPGNRRLPWPSRAERAAARDVMDRLGIGALADRHIRELSGGQQQRMFIARALLGQPQLLVMDEPTSGVDVKTRHEVLHLLADLNADGLAVVLTTHDLNGMASHLPHLVCMNTSIVASGAPADVLTSEVMEATFGAAMEVFDYSGHRVVIDLADTAPIIPLMRDAR
ncbi:MAG: metal ABC transporter ATP-binding protein [Acidimicrobiales bacterium]